MNAKQFAISVVAVSVSCTPMMADTPAEIYQRRILPLLQSSSASSCSECHLQGLQLNDFLKEDPKETFAQLRSRGWINVNHPSESKLLQFISKKHDPSNDLIDKVREAERKAVSEWIFAAVKDPESLDTPLPKQEDLKLDSVLIQHMRKDQIVIRFVDAIWSQLERCANCHSPDRNAKQVEKHGSQMSWIVPNSPDATLEQLQERKLIDLQDPSLSLLRTKAIGKEEHGGGMKFPENGQTDREWLAFLEDYSLIRHAGYESSKQLPRETAIRTWRTPLHLRVKEIPNMQPGQYAVVVVIPRDNDGKTLGHPVAYGEGVVGRDGSSWSTTLVLLEPKAISEQNEKVAWEKELPNCMYELRWIPLEGTEKSLSEVLATQPVSFVQIDSLWQPGHSGAKSISFREFNPINR